MLHACVPPRCGRMRVPEGLERGAGITRICSDADGSPEEATGATLWQRFPWDASRSISHVAEMPQPPGDRQSCHERSRFEQERLFCSPGPGTQDGPPSTGTGSERDSRVTTCSSKVRPGRCGRSERTRPSRGRAPGSLAVGVTGTEWPVTGIQWPLPVGLGLAARHRQVPLLRQMQGNAGVELPHKSPASFNIEERSSPRVT